MADSVSRLAIIHKIEPDCDDEAVVSSTVFGVSKELLLDVERLAVDLLSTALTHDY